MPTWPVSLPQKPAANSWSGGPAANQVAFQPDVGDAITRRRGTAVHHVYQGRFTALTLTQLNAFVTFFESDLADGTLTFTWTDPIYGDSSTWRVDLSESPAYTVSEASHDTYDISLGLIRVPD